MAKLQEPIPASKRAAERTPPAGAAPAVPMDHRVEGPVGSNEAQAAELLIDAMRELSRARTRDAVAEIVKRTARRLVGADGATFVLKEGDKCFYLDEDAISPLWKGQRFPLETCVSGWVMTHAEQLAMPDIYVDPRVPYEAYRPTFVKSLVMTPVRTSDPIAAIGIYWGDYHIATERELALLQNLADTTAVALENAQVYSELEARVTERTEQLTHANLELEAFSQTVAHDLRSPLNAIIGFAELLEDGADAIPPAQVHDFASEISTAGRRMADLIAALLEFARNARCDVQKTDVDLSAVARRVVSQLPAAACKVAPEFQIESGVHASADAALMEVVLTNLLSNALKYSAKSSAPRIAFGQVRAAAASPTYFVRDNGAGFDPALSERLFAPFQRLHDAREFAGHGVGLATVARIVLRHGGKIWAEGKVGAGATFFFSLPAP